MRTRRDIYIELQSIANTLAKCSARLAEIAIWQHNTDEPIQADPDYTLEAAGITLSDLRNLRRDDRRRVMVNERQRIALLLWNKGWTLSRIGRLLGRNHTTIHHLIHTRANQR